MASGTIKSCNQIAIFICPNWNLCLITIAKWVCHSKDWLTNRINKRSVITANLYQIIRNNIVLDLQLLSIFKVA